MTVAVVAIAHGTVERLDDLPAFLANIRRGNAAPPELVADVRRRYEAIGGRSPLNDVCAELARKIQGRLGVATRLAMRLWHPFPRDVLVELAREGVDRVVVLPLAQHSAKVYGEAVQAAAAELLKAGGPKLDVVWPGNWGREPKLTEAYAAEIRRALEAVPTSERPRTTLLMTAHSLPVSVVRGGDPYESEVRASAEAIVRALGPEVPRVVVAFQSQGMSLGPGGAKIEWLGPDLRSEVDAAALRGDGRVIVAAIGFLADHVETLYDLDIEARGWATSKGIAFERTRSLNASDALVEAALNVVRPLLGGS